MLRTNRGLAKFFFLSLITFGIYGIVCMSHVASDLNKVATPRDGKHTMQYWIVCIFLTVITLGIAFIVWNHRICNRIGNELQARNIPYHIGAGTFWGWGIFGYLILVGPFIYLHKFFKAMNYLNADYNNSISQDTAGDSSAHTSEPTEAQGPVAVLTAANAVAATGVHGYDELKLNDIIDNAPMYKSELVEQCRHELQVRADSEKFMQEVNEYSDERLNEILSTRDMYAEELVYCCERVSAARTAERNRIAAEEAEALRIKRESEAKRLREEAERLREEKHAKRIEWWKKWWPVVLVAVSAALATIVILILTSDIVRYKQGVALAQKGQIDQAYHKYSLITNEKSRYYSYAQYEIFQIELFQRDNRAAAAEALTRAVVNDNWEHIEAYQTYASYLVSGELAPTIQKNRLIAARLYEKSPYITNQIQAGELYFQLGQFETAYNIFYEYPTISESKGYIGIMYLYGLNGFERNPKTAWSYLKEAPDRLPFAVHKGDLILFLKPYGTNYSNENIKNALKYYEIAAFEDPNTQAYVDRFTILTNFLQAYENHRHDNWNTKGKRWDSYTTNNGSYYRGETTTNYSNFAQYASGWGCFNFNDSSIRIRDFGKTVSLGININSDYSITVGQLSGDYANLKEGAYTSNTGNTSVGTFSNTLIKGNIYDVGGNLIRTLP